MCKSSSAGDDVVKTTPKDNHGMFCKIKSRSCGEGFEDFYVVPGDGLSSGQGFRA